MTSNSFKMRTFDAGANHEIVLPNGKVVLIDPYFIRCKFPDFTREDVTGADYIIVTHGHFDHDSDVGYFIEKFNSKVFCGVMTAEYLMKFHKIPFDNLFPVFPNSKFTMDDLTLELMRSDEFFTDPLLNYMGEFREAPTMLERAGAQVQEIADRFVSPVPADARERISAYFRKEIYPRFRSAGI